MVMHAIGMITISFMVSFAYFNPAMSSKVTFSPVSTISFIIFSINSLSSPRSTSGSYSSSLFTLFPPLLPPPPLACRLDELLEPLLLKSPLLTEFYPQLLPPPFSRIYDDDLALFFLPAS